MVTKVIHQDNLMQQFGGRTVEDARNSPEENGVGLVVEDDDHRSGGEVTSGILTIHTPVSMCVCVCDGVYTGTK